MKKNVLLLLTSLMMACIVAGCSEDEFNLRGDEIVYSDGIAIKYSPRDINNFPDFLHVKEINASDDFSSWFGCYIWTGILDGKRYYYESESLLSSRGYGYIYTETGEEFEPEDFENWTDVEVIYIHPKYIEYCRKNKQPLGIWVPRS